MKTKRNRKSQQQRLNTRAVHSGEKDGRYANAITVPIAQTSTFVFPSTQEIKRYTSGKLARYEYGRYGTPTQRVAEEKLADVEGADKVMDVSAVAVHAMSVATSLWQSLYPRSQLLSDIASSPFAGWSAVMTARRTQRRAMPHGGQNLAGQQLPLKR